MTKGKGWVKGVNVHMREKQTLTTKITYKQCADSKTHQNTGKKTFNASPSAVTTSVFSLNETKSSLVTEG